MAKIKESKAGLKRQLAAANKKAEEWERHYDGAINSADNLTNRVKELTDRLTVFKGNEKALLIENAELHGYINRVEIEDDTNWHLGSSTTHKDGETIIPPLRQRKTGQGYPNNTYHQGGPGRPARSRVAG